MSTVIAPRCVYCQTFDARPGHSTCSDSCERYLKCFDRTCTCNTTECAMCGAPIQLGKVICSLFCAREAEYSLDHEAFEKIFHPHS